MQSLREWALMLVFIALSGFIYWYLLPSGRISETAKTVVSLLAVASVCIPVFAFIGGADTSLSFFTEENGETSVFEPTDYYIRTAEKIVAEKLSLIIGGYTDSAFEIVTDIHITGDACIDIEQVSVIFETYPEKLPELSLAIEEALGIAPVFSLREKEDAEGPAYRKIQE